MWIGSASVRRPIPEGLLRRTRTSSTGVRLVSRRGCAPRCTLWPKPNRYRKGPGCLLTAPTPPSVRAPIRE